MNLEERISVLEKKATNHRRSLPKMPRNNFVKFNRWLGNPFHPKLRKETDVFSFQVKLRNQIRKHRKVIVNKFTGAGGTELIPRIFLEMMLADDLPFKQYVIVSGLNMKFTEQVIQNRVKGIITKKHPELIESVTKDTILLNNGTYFRGYPTEHIDTIRGQDDIMGIFIDEAAFFHSSAQDYVRTAIERYVLKTNPYIIWLSTPNGLQGAFYKIWTEAEKHQNDYFPITIPYSDGVDSQLLDPVEIEKKKKDRTFLQEYDNQFLSPPGAIMSPIRSEQLTLKEEVL